MTTPSIFIKVTKSQCVTFSINFIENFLIDNVPKKYKFYKYNILDKIYLEDLIYDIDYKIKRENVVDKKLLLEELNFDKIEMQETTKRWVSDNNTDSYLTRNIRPLTLAFLTATLFVYIILDSSLDGFKIAPEWIDLLSSLLLLVYGGYFGMRSAEKITKHFKK